MQCLRATLPVLLALSILAAPRPQSVSLPSWLAAFPGTTAVPRDSGGMVETTYSTPAKPADVVEHYRKLFEAADLPFQPNPNGMGTSIRGAAPECDLLILIRPQGAGTGVDVSCVAKSPAPAAAATSAVEVINGGSATSRARTAPHPVRTSPTAGQPHLTADEIWARHAELAKQIHPVYHDAPAPPLVWPSWLAHVQGGELPIQRGTDQSRKAYLESRYVTTQPMSRIYAFYKDLLAANEYPVHSSELSTGHTMSGVQQNALGHVEGTNYPDGAPGPRTVIRVDFSRSHLNDPITVRMRITAYEFVAGKSPF